MKKNNNIHFWFILVVSIIVLELSSCNVAIPINTPTVLPPTPIPTIIIPPNPSSTAVLEYVHYSPPKEYNIHLEFDYPSHYLFGQEILPGSNIISIGFSDPRFLALPTPDPNVEFAHPVPNDFGSVDILIQPADSDRTLNTVIEHSRQASKNSNAILELDNYSTMIDGYEASVFEYQMKIPEVHSSLMFKRIIFFSVENMIYKISFEIAVIDRGGEFEQVYEYFLNSIKISP